ncbi:MAG TPA: hypothetical protein VFK58_04635 [Sphingomicrobium sp.]|nr:hypothetical protein [Sphingomicrobium sp.]
MGDNRTDLPEGTDEIITGAAETGPATGSEAGGEEALVSAGTAASTGQKRPASDGALASRLRSGGEKLSAQAGDKARGLVSQGLERSAEALANVGKLVGDTAVGLEERLGPEYGDYARRAAAAIENTANSIAAKDADELIEDTREFVRRSPGVAIAGAAIVGFALARLIKSGLDSGRDDDNQDDRA